VPWILAKDEEKQDRLETVLFNLLLGIKEGARLLEPFIPETSKNILEQVGDEKVTDTPEILFHRLDIEEVLKKVAELYPAAKPEEEEEGDYIEISPKEEITFEQFGQMQFQIGEVISCEEVNKSKKLLYSQVKIGNQTKQIVSGIKGYYTPEEMVGKKVMVIVNLKPVKLAGLMSEGMLLCANGKDGEPILMVPEKDVPRGAEIS
jgi:methionyl-tRNA synthetase